MQEFLCHHNVFLNVSIRDKTCLIMRHNLVQTLLQSVDHDFTNHFIYSIAQSNEEKLSYLLRIRNLWNETYFS